MPLVVDALVERTVVEAGTPDVAVSSMYIPNWPGTSQTGIRVDGRSAGEIAGAIQRVHNVTARYFRT